MKEVGKYFREDIRMDDNYKKESVPSLEEAKLILKEAEKLNPGPWVVHSINVAEGAKLIAEQTDNLNPKVAYILGMLHDIGRREGVHAMKHGIDGYRYAISLVRGMI